MRENKSVASLLFILILGLGGVLAYARHGAAINPEFVGIGAGAFILAMLASSSIQIADQWDKVIILRLGHFHALKGPGLFFIIPVIDPYWIDTRVITTGFKAEKTHTKDTVPVDVDAVFLRKVADPKQAALTAPTLAMARASRRCGTASLWIRA
jgi:regulator of protease activity HflC (stomatin/prohibitin superfamily)